MEPEPKYEIGSRVYIAMGIKVIVGTVANVRQPMGPGGSYLYEIEYPSSSICAEEHIVAVPA